MVYDPTIEGRREIGNRFRQLIQRLPLAAALVDRSENVEFLNEKFTRTFGYTIEDIPSIDAWMRRAYPDEAYRIWIRDNWRNLVRAALERGEEVGPLEAKTTCKDGTVKVAEFFSTIVDGKFLIMFRDITEQSKSREELRAREAKLQSIFRAAPVGIGVVERRVIRDVNDRLCEMTGYASEELIGRSARILYPTDEDFEFVGREKYRQIDERGTGNVETRWRRRDGSVIHIILSSTPLDPGNLDAGVTFTALDITLRKQYEDELQEAKARAELYVDLMGHDINNMNQIALGFLELARDVVRLEGKLDAGNVGLIEKPIESLMNSSKLIENVRKLQKERLGHYRPIVVDLGRLLEEVKEQYAEIPGRDVTIHYRPVGGYRVRANELLKDVFLNLVGNAIKHSRCRLVIRIKVGRMTSLGKKYYKVEVEDNGPGIPDDMKETLFDRLSLATTRARGRGFGLCLIKMLIDDFRGEFWMEDRVAGDYRKGARFIVLLPALDD